MQPNDLYQNVKEREEEVLKWACKNKKDIKEIWETKTLCLSNIMLETNKLPTIKKVLQGRLDQHKGDMVVFRINPPLLAKLMKYKTREQIKAKFPEASIFDIEFCESAINLTPVV